MVAHLSVGFGLKNSPIHFCLPVANDNVTQVVYMPAKLSDSILPQSLKQEPGLQNMACQNIAYDYFGSAGFALI